MTPSVPGRFRQADAIFDAVLDLDTGERASFVERACEGDPALKATVLRLLHAYEHSHDFLDVPALELARPLLDDPQPAIRPARLTPLPDRIGGYRVVRELGRGGMGVVYLAERDAEQENLVALKVVRGGARIAGSVLRRFLSERRILSGLEHPYIARLLDAGTTPDGTPWFAMAYCAGGSLADRLAAGPLPVDHTLRVARQLAEALEAAHALGVVHRDVKPANVLFSAAGDVQLTDFGVAKLIDQESTQSGSLLGTPAYLAPEQLRGARVDHRADLWALGVTLYQMVTGQRPFDGPSYAAILHAVVSVHPASMLGHAPQVPGALDALCQHLLAKDPDARPGAAGEVASILGRIAASPTMVYRVPALSVLTPTTPPLGRPRNVGIVVLPFVNMSGNPDDAPFTDGLTDALTAALGKVRGLRVTARTTAFALRAKGLEARAIANVLGVSTVLEGTVRRSGDRVRVTAQLVNAADATVAWSENWDRQVRDVFDLQDDLARAIVDALGPTLSGDFERSPMPARDVATYELYLKGRYFLERRTHADLQVAARYFEQAVAIDPSYAEAHAAVADARFFMLNFGNLSPQEQIPSLRESIARALASGRGIAAVHATHGNLLLNCEWQWAAAEGELRYALELDPGYSPARVFLAMLLALFRYDESIDVATRALALDPLSPPLNLALGRAYLHAGRTDEALRPLRSVVDIAPGFAFAQAQLGHALMQVNRKAEALAAFRRAADGGSLNDRGNLAWALAVTGDVEAAQGILGDLLAIEGRGYLPPFGVALAYVGIGDLDAACDWLERGEQERAPHMCTIGVAPGIGVLRGHPRFEAILRRMELDDASLAARR